MIGITFQEPAVQVVPYRYDDWRVCGDLTPEQARIVDTWLEQRWGCILPADHRALLALLRGLSGRVILSGYPSPIYDEVLPGWPRRDQAPRGGRKEEGMSEKTAEEDGQEVRLIVSEIVHELARARTLFPGKNVTLAALMEEVGELAKATFSEPAANVRKEAVQVAVMAIRMALDGDHTFDDWRRTKGLDALGLES